MLGVLRTLTRPWRMVRRVRALKDAILTHLGEVRAEVRELHQSSLLAAIHVIEEQQRAREDLTKECARLERRIAVLEQQLGAGGRIADEVSPARLDRAA
jgi:hypothetical protein